MYLKWWTVLLVHWASWCPSQVWCHQKSIQDGTIIDEPRVDRLECYVCSWSVMGPRNHSAYDICSTGNFDRDAVHVVQCKLGCQSVSFKVSEKDEIRNFYRNCLKPDDRHNQSDRCYKVETVYGFETRCECWSNLCNGARSTTVTTMAMFLGVIPISLKIS